MAADPSYSLRAEPQHRAINTVISYTLLVQMCAVKKLIHLTAIYKRFSILQNNNIITPGVM